MPDTGKPVKEERSGTKVTLREVAEAVGVSVSTASRVLSGAPGISSEVRYQVQNAAQALNYGGTSVAKAQVSIITDLNTALGGASEFIQAVQRGIEKRARDMGVNLTITLVGPAGLPATVRHEDASGCLLLSMQSEELISELIGRDVPAVIVNGRENLMRLDALAPANRTGGYLAARHVLDLGHRNILVLSHSGRPTIRDRLLGARRAMREAGIEDDLAVMELEDMRTDLAYRDLRARLDEKGGADFTAVVCCNDSAAFGAMAALAEYGLNVPEDISVIGFDDVPTAALNSVPLTTISVDAEDLGARGLIRLMERMRAPGSLVTYTETAVRLVPRASTASVPQG
ncbi:MAG: LacI family DNA-binding transcriptional regulator [Maritimibacter sp.]